MEMSEHAKLLYAARFWLQQLSDAMEIDPSGTKATIRAVDKITNKSRVLMTVTLQDTMDKLDKAVTDS